MILHIVPDEKFIDMAYKVFEKSDPDNNEVVVITKQENLNHIKITPVIKKSSFDVLSKNFTKNLEKYEFVVLHWLDEVKMQLVMNSSSKVKFIWIGWGGDYYQYINKELFLPSTKKIIAKQNGTKRKKIKLFKLFLKNKLYMKDIKKVDKVFKRIKYFAPVLYEDYKLLKNEFKEFHPKYIDWNYGTLEDDLIKGYENFSIDGDNILIGNSDTATNNHMEVFDMVKLLNTEKRQIIVPLSYGNIEYRDQVIKYGENVLENFNPLINFMHIDEYNKIISTCSIVIMNHLRQQAVGNIVIMLYFGAKIYLNRENPVYDFFKRHNAIIFSIDELTNESINMKLTKDEIDTNRNILRMYWSRSVIMGKTKKLINLMKEG